MSKDSHYNTNKDNDNSNKGKEKISGTKINYHKLSRNIAQRHSNVIVDKHKAKTKKDD